MFRSVLLLFVLVCVASSENAVETVIQPDGEVVVKVKFNNLTVIQTSSGGYNLMQGQVLNCDYSLDPFDIDDFFDQVDDHNCRSGSACTREANSSITVQSIDELPSALSSISRNQILVEKCQEFHHEILSQLQPTPFPKTRRKRADHMLFPGTQWCGSGYSAKNFNQLGYLSAADRCCRDHDHCKHTIAPFSTKYHLFNYRFHTISHCRCDKRFRTCLRSSNSGASNLIGKLFFNVVKSKCFTFKKEKVCKRRTWWGTCAQFRKTRRAYIRKKPFLWTSNGEWY